MKIINKIIRKISGSELAQQQTGGNAGGKANEDLVPILRKAAADGCVLLKNNNNILPFTEKNNIAVFGRVQNDYFYVGNGSGGDVRTPYKISLAEGLDNCNGIHINSDLADEYKQWSDKSKNIPDPGFWGHWPRFYPEMPLKKQTLEDAVQKSDCALVVIGRSAGEDRENVLEKGSYYLTKGETDMLDAVTAHFERVALILNIGNLMDFEKINQYGDKIGAIMIVWQGGMESGNAVADVLSGNVNPSGRLTDTIAKKYHYYPGSDHFGNKEKNQYVEDIYVGYRYFETFRPDKVLYEFGFGLSYTEFETTCKSADYKDGKVTVRAEVKNVGERAGREVVQLYCEAPQGKLKKPLRVLVGFYKTESVEPGETEKIEIVVGRYGYASYDDSGITGNKSSYVLESGEYSFYLGTSVKKCAKVLAYEIEKDIVLCRLSEVMAVKPEDAFERYTTKLHDGKIELEKEPVPLRTTDLKQIILSNLPEGKELTGDKGYKLSGVKDGSVSMEDFVAQLSEAELELIVRGEGLMNSSLGAPGNAGVIGGVSQSLRDKGIPAMTTTDGPSGIRLLDSCSLMPCGTALACTWDMTLVEELFEHEGKEMLARKTDVLLAPGMNIHRNPLCGRNFEYYSEDPLISGKTAAATVRGIQKNGVSACPKHFACNNQEKNRCYTDSIVSERALREIYLKGFEICVKESAPLNIMTSYNKINGVWSHYNYELCTTVLRNEWKYDGSVMTDWWMRYAPSPEFPDVSGNGYRVRSQVDVLMPGGKTAVSKSAPDDGTLLASLGKPDGITLGELQRSAANVLKFIIHSNKSLN